MTHVAIVNELSSELLDHRQLLQSLVDWSVGVPSLSQVSKQIDLQWAGNELKTDERLEQVRIFGWNYFEFLFFDCYLSPRARR